MKGKESKIQKDILDWLDSKVTKVNLKIIVANKAGWSDIVASISGVFTLIEVKQPGEYPTPLQEYKLKLIEQDGGVGIWADSLKMAKEKLRRHPCLKNVKLD